MQVLYHHPICPFSRQTRVYLREFDKKFDIIKEDRWNGRKEFLKLNPAGTLPVIEISEEEILLVGIYPIIEYMVDTYKDFHFMPTEARLRAESRKYLDWFNVKFYKEITRVLIDEKIVRLALNKGYPRTELLRIAKSNLVHHLKFLSNRLSIYAFIVYDKISCADIAAAAHISVLDYFGEINWDNWPEIRHWYSLIKSRPGFRQLLTDYIPGFTPPKEYSELDF